MHKSIKILIIFSVRAFNLAVMPGSKGSDQVMSKYPFELKFFEQGLLARAFSTQIDW